MFNYNIKGKRTSKTTMITLCSLLGSTPFSVLQGLDNSSQNPPHPLSGSHRAKALEAQRPAPARPTTGPQIPKIPARPINGHQNPLSSSVNLSEECKAGIKKLITDTDITRRCKHGILTNKYLFDQVATKKNDKTSFQNLVLERAGCSRIDHVKPCFADGKWEKYPKDDITVAISMYRKGLGTLKAKNKTVNNPHPEDIEKITATTNKSLESAVEFFAQDKYKHLGITRDILQNLDPLAPKT